MPKLAKKIEVFSLIYNFLNKYVINRNKVF